MPLAICIIASVMMKEGMPTAVTPNALTRPSAKQLARVRMMATAPFSGILAMFTYSGWIVK